MLRLAPAAPALPALRHGDRAKAGWTRTCPVDGSEHFPRTDPAVIMLVHDGAGRCVLARGPQWRPGRMSVLAGFVEAGESAEAAVAREVREEVGIAVRDVTYVASQPHPFPASLMLGYTARVDGDPRCDRRRRDRRGRLVHPRGGPRDHRLEGAEVGGRRGRAALRGLPSQHVDRPAADQRLAGRASD